MKKYIKDLAVTLAIAYDNNDTFKGDKQKLRKRMLNAIKNYCNLRMKIMQNSTVQEVEHKAVIALVKIGLDSACKEYNLDIPKDTRDKIVDECMPQVLDAIHELRYSVFKDVLNFTDGRLNKEY